MVAGGYCAQFTAGALYSLWMMDKTKEYDLTLRERVLAAPAGVEGAYSSWITYGWSVNLLSRSSLKVGDLRTLLGHAESHLGAAPGLVRLLASARHRSLRESTRVQALAAYRKAVDDLLPRKLELTSYLY